MIFEGFRSTAATNPIPLNTLVSNQDRWADDSITYVVVTQDRLENNKRNFPVILPHVDRAVVVDGFSKDGTFDYLKSLGSKVQIVQNKWEDSFAKQYNQYLKHIKGGWVLLCDDDELPSDGLLRSLRELVKQSENGSKFSTVEFRANDISYQVGKWDQRVDNGPCEYYRQIFFKWYPDMRYEIDLHQALIGLRGPIARCTEHYYHIKSTRDEYRNACRNWWVAGIWHGGASDGVRGPEWHALRDLALKHHPEIEVFSDFNAHLVSGSIHPDVETHIRGLKDYKRGDQDDFFNELRAFYRYYFEILHPEKA
jgi:glycosyltransferase involved in cell wall biosynthesis